MRFEPNKAFRHPVLRPSQGGPESGDFPYFDFQTSFTTSIDEGAERIRIDARFAVQQADILRAIHRNEAEYSLLIVCPTTYFRRHLGSKSPELQAGITLGDVDREIELRPSIVANREIAKYRPDDLHQELQGQSYLVDLGGLLAQEESWRFPASREFLRPITSIFHIVPDAKLPSGQLDIVVGDTVEIRVNNKDNARLAAARKTNRGRQTVMNAVYVPAVMNLLAEAIRLQDDAADSRWYSVVQYQLREIGVEFQTLCDGRTTLWHAAQALLKFPGRYAEFMREEEAR